MRNLLAIEIRVCLFSSYWMLHSIWCAPSSQSDSPKDNSRYVSTMMQQFSENHTHRLTYKQKVSKPVR